MALIDKLNNIADEIRNKTGLTDKISLEQMKIDIAASPSKIGNVKDYVKEEAERVAAEVKALQNENTISFIAMSDLHISSDTQSQTSYKHAAQAASIIAEKSNIDFTAILGDIVLGAASDSKEQHITNHMNSLRTNSIIRDKVMLVGNHDANSYNANSFMTNGELYNYIGRFNINVNKPAAAANGYFYFDIEAKKTRVVCLNSCEMESTQADGHYITANQYQWLVNALDMTGKSGWRIIVLSHHPIHWYGYMPNVLTILTAYVEGKSGSIAANGSTVSYNFSGKNAAKLIAAIHGHTHNLIQGKAGTAEIIRMGTPNGCYGRNNEYGSSSYNEDFRGKYGETTTYSKTANTAKDTAFCVYTIDYGNEVIYSTCYGAGYDRMMNYGQGLSITIQPTDIKAAAGDTVVFSVVATGVKSYQWQVGGTDGTSWTDLTWSGSNTATMTHMMNETNITYVYRCVLTGADGTTLTTNVIKFLPPYTNQIPISIGTDGKVYNSTGYKAGYRLSTSSGSESSAAGMTATGFIPLDYSKDGTSTIRVKDIDLTNGNSTGVFYDANFKYVSGWYCNNVFGAADDNGVRAYTSTSSNQAYVRISGAFGTNPIITVNEEIK